MTQPLAPIAVPWTMKPLDSAQTSVERDSRARLRFSITHDVIAGVTPAMIVWWLNNMIGDVDIGGRTIERYRAWHPIDHVKIEYVRKAKDGSNMGPGSRVRIRELFQARPEYLVDVVDDVLRCDEGGFVHVNRRGGVEVGRMEYTFTPVAGGTLYQNCLIVGMGAPGAGLPFNALVRPLLFPEEKGRAWLRHNVEEVGNLQFFLPDLYDRCR